MNLLLDIIDALFTLYLWIVIARVVLSWLVGFNIVNPYSPVVRAIQTFVYRATEPLMGPIRRFMPDLGGLDISPIVLLFGMEFVHILIIRTLTGQLLS